VLDQVKQEFARRFKDRDTAEPRTIGFEAEFPLVTAQGEAAPLAAVQRLFERLGRDGFSLEKDPTTGVAVAAEGDFGDRGSHHTAPLDRVEMELGYCTLELSLAPQASLFAVKERLDLVMRWLVDHLGEEGVYVLGYGIQPLTRPTRELQAPKGRCATYECLSPNKVIPAADGRDIHLFAISAACHYHVDVCLSEAARSVSILNGLAGLLISPCVNSPIWRGERDPRWLGVREIFYDIGMTQWMGRHGNSHRFSSADDYVETICSFPPIMVKREGRFLTLPHYQSAFEYFQSRGGASALESNGNPVTVQPQASDILLFSNMWWQTARLSPRYGTVEARSFCQQPPSEALGPAAMVLGIVENMEEAENFLGRRPWQDWVALRPEAIALGLRARLGGQPITSWLHEILRISRVGLLRRGLGEEEFLDLIVRRCSELRTPADRAVSTFQKFGLAGLVRTTAY